MKRYIPVFLLSVAFLVGLQNTAFGEAHFTAKLDGDQEVPSVATPATGTASFTLSPEGLHYFITVEGLSGPITGAQIHLGARGVAGAALRDILSSFGLDGTALGLWRPTDAQPLNAAAIAALLSGRLYVNIDTAANPGGEIRGQIDLSAGSFFTANLTGDQENPQVPVAARGTGSFVLHAGRSELTYSITVTGLSGAITAAHIHTGEIGVNGGVAFTLTPSFTGTTASGTWSGLTAANISDLLAGRLYVNVHTAAHPGGEIRGQILLSSGFGLSTHLDGSQEVPPVATAGQGSASLTLTPDGLQFDITVSEMTGIPTSAHFHRAPFGANGPVVRDITAAFGGGGTASGLWRPTDAQPLTLEMICALLEGEIYVNVHTAAHPGGEIRGQVGLNSGITTLTATLTGDEEEPPVPTAARGTGTFRLTGSGLEYSITVVGLSGPITSAHIHRGAIGAAGGVEWTLTPDFGGTLTAVGTWGPASAPPLTTSLIKDLLQGNLYANIHTAAHPAGEIRGQITLASGSGLQGPLTPEQETPAVASPALGTASYTLTDNGLVFGATVDGLSGAFTAAHFHNARTRVNGGVVRDVTGEFAGNHARGVWSAADASPLTGPLVDELLAGNVYLNVHTAPNPAGEIRGQLFPSEGFGYQTTLHGGNEIPAVSTRATAIASLTLTETGLIYAVTADRLTGTPTAAHFHNAPQGSSGPVVRDITGTFIGNTARGNWQPPDATPLTPALICELLRGNIYINIHTATNPGGEIRGNLGSRTAASADDPRTGEAAGIILFQNYPNPVSGPTSVAFRLPREGYVTLKLYSVEGREVSTLLEGRREAGLQQVTVDSNRLPSGIYLYRIETGGVVQTKKMLIRK